MVPPRCCFALVALVLLLQSTHVCWALDNLHPFVAQLVSRMTLAEKVGQMLQPERAFVTPADVAQYFIGSVLSGGGSVPGNNTLNDWRSMVDAYQAGAMSTRLKIPMVYGQDAVHGMGNVYGATIFPHNIGLGAANSSKILERMGQVVAEEMAAAGTTWAFSPCVAVPRDDRWGRTYEGFGEVPELAHLGAAYIRGLQKGGRILCSVKHFMGDGGTQFGSSTVGLLDQGNTVCDEATLRRIHLPGYIAAVKSEAATVMASYSSWNGVKMHQNKYLLTDVLKGELGFRGFVVSDYNAIDQLPFPDYDTKVITAVNAGVDMIMEPDQWRQVIAAISKGVLDGRVNISRVDDAVQRILSIKHKFGLFTNPWSNYSAPINLGSAAHRAVARDAVRKSLVLLKNDSSILPLNANQRIFVAGPGANDIGLQCGGWTKAWQGQPGPITPGTTLLQGIQTMAADVTYDPQGVGAAGHDVAIVVLAEQPYAEMHGDTADLTMPDLPILDTVLKSGVPTILVVISGRPVTLAQTYVDRIYGMVAAWLPGTEGQGVADVLFGLYPFTGKLPVSWPRSTAQEPINWGDSNYDPMFPFGFSAADQ